jgi:RimJ/RimL family protein N-acetyltransferase
VPIPLDHPLLSLLPELGIRLSTPAVTLASPTLAELAELAEAARKGIHDPETMPFAHPWTRGTPEIVAERVARFWLASTGNQEKASPRTLLFVAFVDGHPVGVQDLRLAEGWPALGTVTTGSWLARPHQGRGIGTWMRRAVLALAFRELGASRARSAAMEDNPASQRVSARLGYRNVGEEVVLVEGREVVELHFELAAHEFGDDPRVRIEGLTDAARHRLQARSLEPR